MLYRVLCGDETGQSFLGNLQYKMCGKGFLLLAKKRDFPVLYVVSGYFVELESNISFAMLLMVASGQTSRVVRWRPADVLQDRRTSEL